MPYSLSWEPRGVVRRYFGPSTIAERRASFEAICRDPRFDSLRYSITDYRDVTQYELSHEATAEIAALHTGPLITNPRIRIAAVAVRPDIVMAIREFIALGFMQAPYRVFASMAEARRWVDYDGAFSSTATSTSVRSTKPSDS